MPILRTILYYAFQRAASDPATQQKVARTLREEVQPRLRTVARYLGPRFRAAQKVIRERNERGK